VTLGIALLVAAMSAQPSAATSVPRLPARLGHDMVRLVTTKTPAIVLVAGGFAAAAAHPADQQTVRSLSGSSGADLFFDAGAEAGDGIVQGLTAIGVYAAGLAVQNERTRQLGTNLVEAQFINFLLTDTIKVIADRTRPNGGSHSFPSGHASATFVTADVLLQQFGWKIGVPAYAGAAYVAISRLSEKQHFLSDVVFGTAVGIASARTLAVQSRGRSFTVAPAPLRGGGAIFVTVGPR
jgi:membrane-associated phospholipid phosphatase